MTKDEQVSRGNRAAALLTDPLMAEAREHIESECWRLFKTLAPTDVEGLAQIKAIQYMHDKYLAFLNAAINDGKLARIEIDRKQPRPTGY